MTTYLEAEANPARNTGAIRLYDTSAFAGMRRASQLTARCLDGLAAIVAPGVTTQAIDDFVVDFAVEHDAGTGDAELSRLHQERLHLDQPRRLPRHPQRQAS